MTKKILFLTQNSYYFVHRYFIDIFEYQNSDIAFVSENQRGIRNKYIEIISYFGIFNFIKCIFYEIFFMLILRNRIKKLKILNIKDHNLNKFLEESVKSKNYEIIISVGCPCLINSKLQSFIPIYNLHGGLIPFQRGRYSPLKSMIKGHKYLGASLHLVDDKYDLGEIISQDYFEKKCNDKLLNYNQVLSLSSQLLRMFFDNQFKHLPNEIKDYFENFY